MLRPVASILAAAVLLGGAAVAPPASVSGLATRPAQAAERTATLVGDLQSELGCPQDWQPSCEATLLEPTGPDGTAYTGTFEVPAGSWAFKVAINGAWDESYPAGNLPLVLEGPATLEFGYDDETNAIGVTPTELAGPVGPQDEALARDSLREPVTDEQFYFLMADRFANGDPTNDTGGLEGDRLATGFDPTDKGVLPRWRPGRRDGAAGLHRGTGHHGDLADPLVQEPPGAGQRGRRQRRLPRLLDHRLHPDRPAPGQQRRDDRAGRCRARPRDEGLLRHHHQPHCQRH
jgi:hypothetical protein